MTSLPVVAEDWALCYFSGRFPGSLNLQEVHITEA